MFHRYYEYLIFIISNKFNSANYFPKNNLIQGRITNARKSISRFEQSPEHFLWSVDQGVATITLNRPERKNPLTFESYA